MSARRPTLASLLFAAVAGLALFTFAGLSPGCGAVDRTSLPVLEAYHGATAAEYKAYVAADATLTEAQKARRIQAVDGAGRYIEGAHQRAAAGSTSPRGPPSN
jgi:hypothetical protein